jgi:hypothetical protein
LKTLTPESTVVRKQDIVAAQMDGETVMMSVKNGKYYNLGTTGGAIWELLEQPSLVTDLLLQLQERYDVTAEQSESDVLPFLKSLLDQKLIELK